MKHCICAQQFDIQFLEQIFARADELRAMDPAERRKILEGKVLAMLFYEPSTRTRLSFESAMLRLGGEVLGTENAAEFSSAVKGESIEDSMRVISVYADAIVLRHNVEGTAKQASNIATVPIINGGDGSGQHPTQALLDMYTIFRECKRLDNLTLAAVGDLAHGRTIRSLCYLLGKCTNITLLFISPEHLRIGDDIKEYLDKHNVSYEECTDLDKHLPRTDIVYMTRIQKERMLEAEYVAAKGKFCIDQENLSLLKKEARVLHPLPHVEEIALPVDVEQEDERVAYFRQAENGLYLRMALLEHLLKGN